LRRGVSARLAVENKQERPALSADAAVGPLPTAGAWIVRAPSLIVNTARAVGWPRSHINVLNSCFYLAIYDAAIAFADLAEEEITTWPRADGLGMTDRTRRLLDTLLAAE
jgi:hypothetical protein